MMKTQNTNTKFSPWPYALIGFLSAFFLYLIGFVIFSSFHSMDLVAKNYYEQEVAFQQQIDREQRSREIREAVKLVHDSASKTLSISLPKNESGQMPEGAVQFYRPSNAALDFEVALNTEATNAQTIDTTDLKSGLWKIKITWESGGEEYYFEDVVIL